MKPGLEWAPEVKAWHAAIGLQEAILHDVFRQIAITGQHIGQPEHVRLIASYERRQPADLALLAAFDRILVIHHMHMLILSLIPDDDGAGVSRHDRRGVAP